MAKKVRISLRQSSWHTVGEMAKKSNPVNRSPLDVLREANERNRSIAGRTLLDMLRYRRLERETRSGREQLIRRARRPEEIEK